MKDTNRMERLLELSISQSRISRERLDEIHRTADLLAGMLRVTAGTVDPDAMAKAFAYLAEKAREEAESLEKWEDFVVEALDQEDGEGGESE